MRQTQHIALTLLALAFLAPQEMRATRVVATSASTLKVAVESGTADTVVLATGHHTLSGVDYISVSRSVVVVGADTLCALQCKPHVGSTPGGYHFNIANGSLSLHRLILLGDAVASFSTANGAYTLSADPACLGGGIVLVNGSLAADSCKLTGNRQHRSGGAISAQGDVYISRSLFDGNAADTGGAIYATNLANISLDDVSFAGNTANSGGAIAFGGALGADINLANSSIASGQASIGGGAISTHGPGYLTITNSRISACTAGVGGAIDAAHSNSRTTIVGSTISGNVATAGNGGGVRAGGMLVVRTSQLANNTATGSGGAVFAEHTLTLDRITIDGNTSAGDGGGVHMTSSEGDFFMQGASTFSGNQSQSGSGGAIFTTHRLNVGSGSTFSNNRAGVNGGAICLDTGSITLVNVTLSGNRAAGGAAIYKSSTSGTVSIDSSRIVSNRGSASNMGGAIHAHAATVNITRNAISNNRGGNGGGLYVNASGAVSLRRNFFEADTASDGGAAYVSSSVNDLLFEKNTVSECRATNGGGLYAAANSKSLVVQNTFVGNSDGGILLDGGSGAAKHTLLLNTIAGNIPQGLSVVAPSAAALYGNILANAAANVQGTLDPNSEYNFERSDLNVFEQSTPINNGGATPTMMIVQGSEAQNAIPNSVSLSPQDKLDAWSALLAGRTSIATDQRDSSRLQGSRLDYGAVERAATHPPLVKLKTVVACDAATFNLREAIDVAQNIRDTFFFSNAARTDTITNLVQTAGAQHTRYYLRFVSVENEVVDRVAEILVVEAPKIVIADGVKPSKAICQSLPINLAEEAVPVASYDVTDTLHIYRDRNLTQALTSSEVEQHCEAGRYYLQLTNRYSCKSKVDSVQTLIDSAPQGSIAQRGMPLSLCNSATAGVELNVQDKKFSSVLTWSENSAGYMSFLNLDTTRFVPATSDAGDNVMVRLAMQGNGTCASYYRYDTVFVQVLPLPTAALAEILLQPQLQQPMFFDTTYRVSIKSTGSGDLYDLALVAQYPVDQPFNTRNPYTEKAAANLPNTPPIRTDYLTWTFDSPRDILAGGDSLVFGFDTYNEACGFLSGSKMTFVIVAKDFCGNVVNSPLVAALPIRVQGVPDTLSLYALSLAASTDTLNACNSAASTRITLRATKLDSYTPSDSTIEHFSLTLPKGIQLVPNSYTPIHNASASTNVQIQTRSDSSTEVTLPIRSGITQGEYSEVAFDMVATQASCGVHAMELSIYYSYIYTYNSGADTCQNKVLLESVADTVVAAKYSLNATYSADAATYRNGWCGSISVANRGMAAVADLPVLVSLYEDVNGNGLLDLGIDTLRATKSGTLATADSSISLRFDSVKVSPGRMLLALAASVPDCQCSPQTTVVPVLSGNHIACLLDTTTYTTAAGMASYSWFVPSGATLVQGGTPSASYASLVWTTAGEHVVGLSYVNNASGIEITERMGDTVSVAPLPHTALLYDSLSICIGTTLDLSATYPYSSPDTAIAFYADRGHTQLPSNVVDEQRMYYARASTAQGCTSSLDSIYVYHDSLPRVGIITPALSSCYNRQVSLEASAEFYSAVQWHSSSALASISSASQLHATYSYGGPGIPADTGSAIAIAVTVQGSRTCIDSTASDTISLLVLPHIATLNLNLLTQPSGRQDICADTVFEILLSAPQGDGLSGIQLSMTEPAGIHFLVTDDSSLVEFPYRSGNRQGLANPAYTNGNTYTWMLPSSINLTTADTLRMRFRIASVLCGATFDPSGSQLSFGASAQTICATPIDATPVISQPFRLVDSISVSDQLLSLRAQCSVNTMNLCEANLFDFSIAIHNNMPMFSQQAVLDRVMLYMPLSFELNNTNGEGYAGPSYNAPSSFLISTPDIIGDEKRYIISGIDRTIMRGDSLVFGFRMATPGGFCGEAVMRVETLNTYSVQCGNEAEPYPCGDDPSRIITGRAADTIVAAAYRLEVCDVRNLDNSNTPSTSSRQRWSGLVRVVNSGVPVPASMEATLTIYDDMNYNSELDPNEILSPLFAEQFLLSETFKTGDTISFYFDAVSYTRYHQMLLHAAITTASTACYCTLLTLPIPVVESEEMACLRQDAHYSTVPGMADYVWSAEPNGTLISPNGSSEIDVQWSDTGPKHVSVSYLDARGERVHSAYALLGVTQFTPLALITDTMSACQGSSVNLETAYSGAEQIYFHTGSTTGTPPPSSAVGSEGWYFAQTINASGCWSNFDSVFVKVMPYLDQPILNRSAIAEMVGSSVAFEVQNVPTYERLIYDWSVNGTPLANTTPTLDLGAADTTLSGVYTVVARDLTGHNFCTSTPARATLSVYHLLATTMVCDESCDYYARQNERLSYLIRIRNIGNLAVNTLLVSIALPPHTAYISGGNFANGSLSFATYNLMPASDAEFSFVLRTDDALDQNNDGQTIAAIAHIFADSAQTLTRYAPPSCGCSSTMANDNIAFGYDGDSTIIAIKRRTVRCPNFMKDDGLNDRFVVENLDQYTNAELTVLNRWGSTVYLNRSYKNDWSIHSANIVGGTYFYTLVLRDADGHEDRTTGYIHVIK
jgi:predicted outer membrane repeat protein